MDNEGCNRSYVEVLMHSLASRIWRHLRPFIKVFFRIIIRFESRLHRHPEKLESGISYIWERLEIPLLVFGMLFGAILAFITGSLAATILLPFAIAKSWPIITTFAPKIAAHLWQSFKDLPSGIYMSLVEIIWPGPEPSTATTYQTAGASRRSRQTFFLSDAAMESRSSDEMETMQNASGSWKVSDTVEKPQLRVDLTSDLRIGSSPVRKHRRSRTGSSISLSGASTPELIKTPLIVNSEGRDWQHRRHRSGSSSPESYFRMTALYNADRAQSASDLRTHRRSGSSSAASIRSQGMPRASDRS